MIGKVVDWVLMTAWAGLLGYAVVTTAILQAAS